MTIFSLYWIISVDEYIKNISESEGHYKMSLLKLHQRDADSAWKQICVLKNELKVLKRKRKNIDEEAISNVEIKLSALTKHLEDLEQILEYFE